MAKSTLSPEEIAAKKLAKKLRDQARVAAWHAAHPDRVKAIHAAWLERNREKERERLRKRRADNPEEHKQYAKSYYENNREKAIAANQKWVAENPDKVLEKHRRWARNNREAACAKTHKFRAIYPDRIKAYPSSSKEAKLQRQRTRLERLASLPGEHHTAADIRNIFATQHGRCAYCETAISAKYHIDHIIALSLGGSNAKENIALACHHCNLKKGKSDIIVFIERMRRSGSLATILPPNVVAILQSRQEQLQCA